MAAALHLMRPLCCEAQRTGCVAGTGPPVHSSTHAILRQASASLGCGHLKNCRPGLAADLLVRMTHSRPWRGHRGAPPPAAAWPPALPRLRPQARAGVHVAGLRACEEVGAAHHRWTAGAHPLLQSRLWGTVMAMGIMLANEKRVAPCGRTHGLSARSAAHPAGAAPPAAPPPRSPRCGRGPASCGGPRRPGAPPRPARRKAQAKPGHPTPARMSPACLQCQPHHSACVTAPGQVTTLETLQSVHAWAPVFAPAAPRPRAPSLPAAPLPRPQPPPPLAACGGGPGGRDAPQASVSAFRRRSHRAHAVMAASYPTGSTAGRNLPAASPCRRAYRSRVQLARTSRRTSHQSAYLVSGAPPTVHTAPC